MGVGFSVSNGTLNRIFSLHFVLPFVLVTLAALHLFSLQERGSANPIGAYGNVERLPFHP